MHQLEASSKAGDAHASLLLGAAYREGKGVRKDERRARRLFGEAADGGEHTALVCLGDMESESGDRGRAEQLYLAASSRRVPEAESRLAHLYTETGDHASALDHAERGAVCGMQDCMLILGRMHYHGIGTEEDHMHALYWFSRCCRTYPEAMRCVGLIRMEKGEPYFDMFKGLAALRCAADRRDTEAKEKLLELRLDAETDGLPDDYFDPPEIPQYTEPVLERMEKDVPLPVPPAHGMLSRLLRR